MIEYYNPRIRHRRQRKPQRNWLWAIIDVLWMLVATFAIGTASMGMGFYAGPLLLLALTAAAVLARNARRNRALIAAGYLDQAFRLNLPVPAMLNAAERSERGILRRRLARMRQAIEGGSPIGYAWQQAMPGAPDRLAGLMESAERLGQLPLALGRALRHPRPRRKPAQTVFLMWYPVLMLLAIAAVGNGVAIFALPKLQAILHDFHLQMPAVTEMTMEVLSAVQVPLLIVAAVVGTIFCGRVLADALPRFRPPRNPWRAITDRLAWYMPLWGRVVHARAFGDLCFVLGAAVEAGQPIDRALLESVEACGNRVLCNRVRQWSQALTSGAPMEESARAARLPQVMVGMLATAGDTGSLGNVLAFLTRYYDGLFSAAAAFLEGAAVPVMVALLGFLVASIGLGLFLPLVKLMDHLGIQKGLL